MIFNLLCQTNQGVHLLLPAAHHGVVVSVFSNVFPLLLLSPGDAYCCVRERVSWVCAGPVGPDPAAAHAMWPILCKVRTGLGPGSKNKYI